MPSGDTLRALCSELRISYYWSTLLLYLSGGHGGSTSSTVLFEQVSYESHVFRRRGNATAKTKNAVDSKG